MMEVSYWLEPLVILMCVAIKQLCMYYLFTIIPNVCIRFTFFKSFSFPSPPTKDQSYLTALWTSSTLLAVSMVSRLVRM